jgi:hypothetical protein
MNRLAGTFIFLFIVLAAGAISAPRIGAQTLYTCGDGAVRSVRSLVEVSTPADRGGPRHQAGPAVYEVAVELEETVYTGRSAVDVTWNFDPTALAVGQPISVCANGTTMVLDRLDGTDFHASVVKVEPSRPARALLSERRNARSEPRRAAADSSRPRSRW